LIRQLTEKILFAFFSLCIVGIFSAIGIYYALSRDLPQLPADLENINLSLPTEFFSADGEIIKVLGERHPVVLDDISPQFRNAIIAVEDAKFYKHGGLDPIGLLRALYQNIRARRVIQGGSTITQQLSKNLFFSFERNWIRKIKELLIALQMEATFTKDQILQAYCNQIYFGSGAYGVEEAAQTYFGKRARDLSILQAALLAGLPNSPNLSNPFVSLDRSMKRTEYVLERMFRTGFISSVQKDEALHSELELAQPREESNPNQYFLDYVISKLEQDYGPELVHFGGLKIYTTLDTRFQRYAELAAHTHLQELEKQIAKRPGQDPLQVALVAVENQTGAVRSMLGGRSYSHSQFNRAVSNNRLPGSSFKPIVYLTAMEELGYSPATVVKDEPLSIEIPGTDIWKPQNFEEEFAGDIVLKKALMNSINVVSAKLMQQLGPDKVIRTARQMGIQSPLGRHLSLALGTSGVSPLEMAGVYSTIANQGIYNEPNFIRRIEDFSGTRLYERFIHGVQKFSPKSVYPLLDMMRGVVEGGTGRMVRRMGFDHPAAGKTGTSNDFKDAWFDGFTNDLTVTVWVGYDDNDPMLYQNGRGLTGASAAAPIWVYFMQKALEGKDKMNFPVPKGIHFEQVDARTGYLASPNSPEEVTVAVKDEVKLSPAPPPMEVKESLSPAQSTVPDAKAAPEGGKVPSTPLSPVSPDPVSPGAPQAAPPATAPTVSKVLDDSVDSIRALVKQLETVGNPVERSHGGPSEKD